MSWPARFNDVEMEVETGTMIFGGERKRAAWHTQMASCLAAGLTLGEALDVASGLPRGLQKQTQSTLAAGASVTQVIEGLRGWLLEEEVLLLNISAQQGRLAEAFERLATRREAAATAQGRLLGMLAYPLFLVHAVLIFGPVSRLVFEQPPPAWPEVVLSAILGIAVLWAILGTLAWLLARRSPSVMAIGRWIPLYGGWLKAAALARLADTLSLLVETGYGVRHGWAIAGRLAAFPPLTRACRAVAEAAESGLPPGAQLANFPIFPPAFRQCYLTGERTGDLDAQLRWYARQAADQAQRALLMALGVTAALVFGLVAIKIVLTILQTYGSYLDQITDMLK